MKAPNKNFAGSLASQRVPSARSGESISVTSGKVAGGPSMTVPGEGKVQYPPGAGQLASGMGDRCACNYAMPMSRYGGK